MEKLTENTSLDFKWLKKRGVGKKNKDVHHYESFIYHGVKYMLYDCVYMYNGHLQEPHIGKLTHIWELPDKTKKVRVHWFFRPEEISKWLGETMTLENEILFATGDGHGLANINSLEAIIDLCNVVCISKDNRNPQPSDEQLKAADFIFYRTFDVQSNALSDKMDDKVGGLEIKYVFNREKSEKPSPLLEGTSDAKEENLNIFTSSETQQLLTKSVPYKLKDDAKGKHQNKDVHSLLERNTNFTETDESHDQPLKKIKSDVKCVEPGVAQVFEKMTDIPSMKSVAHKGEMKVGVVPVEKVENRERNKRATGSDEFSHQSLKKFKSDDKKPPEEKRVILKVAHDPERSKEMSSKKSAVDSKPRNEGKSPADVNNLKAYGTRGTTEDPKNSTISAEVTSDDLEGKTLKKTRDDGSFKVPDNKVENRERNKRPTGSDKLYHQPLKKFKSDDKIPPEEKRVELKVAHDFESFKEMSIKKSALDSNPRNEGKPPADGNNLKASGTRCTKQDPKSSKISAKVTSDDLEGKTLKKTRDDGSFKVQDNRERNTRPTGSDKLYQPLKKFKSDDKKPPEVKCLELKVAHDSERSKEIFFKKSVVDSKPRNEGKSPADVNNLKASGACGTTEDPKNSKISANVTSDDLEGKTLKKTRDDGSFKVPDNNMSINTNVRDSVALSKGKSISGIALDSLGHNTNNKEANVGQFGESKKGLSMNKSLKVSGLSTGKEKKKMYQEFVVSPNQNSGGSGRFKRPPWEVRLKNAYNQGTAILLYNLDPDYNSGEVEDIIWHAFKENCDAKILQRIPISSPHYAQALILLKTKEAAERVLTKLDEECLMLSNGRQIFMPVVGTPCPPISTEKNSRFFGHLAIDKPRFQNRRENEAVSTSHFSQPNTIEYDMAMEWCFLQFKFVKWWEKFYELQGLELENLKNDFKKFVHKV